MDYVAEAMSPVEIGQHSPCRIHFNEISNNELRGCELNFLEERKDASQTRLAIYQ